MYIHCQVSEVVRSESHPRFLSVTQQQEQPLFQHCLKISWGKYLFCALLPFSGCLPPQILECKAQECASQGWEHTQLLPFLRYEIHTTPADQRYWKLRLSALALHPHHLRRAKHHMSDEWDKSLAGQQHTVLPVVPASPLLLLTKDQPCSRLLGLRL